MMKLNVTHPSNRRTYPFCGKNARVRMEKPQRSLFAVVIIFIDRGVESIMPGSEGERRSATKTPENLFGIRPTTTTLGTPEPLETSSYH